MTLHWLDLTIFVLFFAVVVGVSMYQSRKERTGEDFFLAGRSLVWPLIGFSLIAANISTEHFVGMSGQGAGIAGFAIASYEWIAAPTLVLVALFFLPKFLKAGIYTIPEYLEYRYHPAARGIMALYLVAIYVGVSIAAVVYTGALALHTIFDLDLVKAVWLIGGIAAIYTTWGGLKAVAWADLFQGSGLILGGAADDVHRFQGRRRRGLVLLGQRRQAPHHHAGRPPRHPLDDPRFRAVGAELLLLGPEPVHHPAHPGRQEPEAGPAGDHLRGPAEARHTLSSSSSPASYPGSFSGTS